MGFIWVLKRFWPFDIFLIRIVKDELREWSEIKWHNRQFICPFELFGERTEHIFESFFPDDLCEIFCYILFPPRIDPCIDDSIEVEDSCPCGSYGVGKVTSKLARLGLV